MYGKVFLYSQDEITFFDFWDCLLSKLHLSPLPPNCVRGFLPCRNVFKKALNVSSSSSRESMTDIYQFHIARFWKGFVYSDTGKCMSTWTNWGNRKVIWKGDKEKTGWGMERGERTEKRLLFVFFSINRNLHMTMPHLGNCALLKQSFRNTITNKIYMNFQNLN